MNHLSLSGVLYAEDFDVDERLPPHAKPAPPPPPEVIVVEPTFSLEDLRRASDRAQQEGRALERRAVEADIAKQSGEALVQVAAALEAARADLVRVAEEAAAATAETIMAAIATALPTFCASHGEGEVRALLALLLPAMRYEPRLSIRTHPAILDALRRDVTPLLNDSDAVVDWSGSETMQSGDVNVRWQDGTMIRDTAALCGRIKALIMHDDARSTGNEETPDGQ